MEKYIISLLDLNSRVIVPELGAFIIRQNDPKELLFNDLLSFDDGVLTDYIMQEDKLSKSEAKNRIRQFTETIQQSLEADKTYNLKKLGILKMDDNNRIEFSTSDSITGTDEIPVKETKTETDEHPDGSQEPEIQIPEIEQPAETAEVIIQAEPKIEEPEIEQPDEATEVTDETEPEIDEEPELDSKMDPGENGIIDSESRGEVEGFELEDGDTEVEIDASQEDTPLKPDGEEPPFQIEEEDEDKIEEVEMEVEEIEDDDKPEGLNVEEELEVTDKTEKQVVKTELEQTIEEAVTDDEPKYSSVKSQTDSSSYNTYSQPSKKKIWPWIVASAAMVIILLAAGWFLFPEKAEQLLSRQVTESIDQDPSLLDGIEGSDISSVDQTGTDQIGEGETGEAGLEETEAVALPVQPEGKRYYVVAGCFSELKNAQNYMQSLLDQGYDASIFGTHKNLHAVCFNSHSSKQDAVNELNRIRSGFDPKAWVLYY
jgi:nucleoid DNA-binding protein